MIFFKALTILSASLLATPVVAQQNCAPYQDAQNTLRDTYGEAIQSQGLTSQGYIIQMWANVESGSWTALIVDQQGVACIASAGVSFRLEPQGDDT